MIYTMAHMIILISIALTLFRLIKGPHAVDRIMSMDLLTVLLACLVVIHILTSEEVVFIDSVLILTLMGFFGTLMYSRYLEKTVEK